MSQNVLTCLLLTCFIFRAGCCVRIEAETEAATPWGACVLAGLGMGYGAAAATAFSRQSKTARAAEPKVKQVARTPVAYPIFTFRWLAVHALTVPSVFFLGAISAMQFIQR